MAKFKITKSTTVAELKEQFHNEFGGVLRVYEGRSEAPEDASLVSLGAKEGDLECRASRTVGKFEEAFQSELGLKVKVYTKDNWVSVLDGITLSTVRAIPKSATKAKMEQFLAYQRDEKEDVADEVEIPEEIKGIPLFDIHMKKVEWPFMTEKEIDEHSDELGAFGVVEVVGMEVEDGDWEKYIMTGDTDDGMYNAIDFIERCKSRYDYEIFKAWISDSIKIYGLDQKVWELGKEIGQGISSFGGADYVSYEWNLESPALFRVQYDNDKPYVFRIDVDGDWAEAYDNELFDRLVGLTEAGQNSSNSETSNEPNSGIFNPDDYKFNKDGLAHIEKNGKYGFIDTKGNLVVDCIYDYVGCFEEGFAPVEKNGKYGFIDTKGYLVIDCIYDNADEFSEGLARVLLNDNYGFIDTKGEVVIECIYYDAGMYFTNGVNYVQKDGQWGIIDNKNNLIVDFTYDDAYFGHDNVIYLEKDNKTFKLDTDGKVVEDNSDNEIEE